MPHQPIRDPGPPPRLSPSTNHHRIEFEVVTTSGRAAAISFHIVDDEVEVWHGARRSGVFARTRLRDWLDAMPRTGLVDRDVGLSVDRLVDVRGRVALTLPDVVGWTLSPTTQAALHKRV